MIIKNVTSVAIRKALARANKKYQSNLTFNRFDIYGRSYRVTLKVLSSNGKGARRGFTGRRMISACWHAHGHFFDALLSLYPEAIIVTGTHKITRDGGNWQDRNIGSIVSPMYFSDACQC